MIAKRKHLSLDAKPVRHAIMTGLLAMAATAMPVKAGTQVYSGPLYDGPAKGSEHWQHERVVKGGEGRESIYNTREPRITVHLPDAAKANGAAVVMLPGGGLRVLGVGAETQREIDAFLDHGVAVLLLEYRTLQIDPEVLDRPPPPPTAGPMKFPKLEIRNGNANPSPNDPALSEVLRLASEDGMAALKLAHDKAAEWKLDPDRIGMMGTSAGGGVAFGALLGDGPPETKPDFIISNFGPALQDVKAPENAPPLYLMVESDHGPVTDGLLALFPIWKDAGHKVELHVYEVPNFSMKIDLWGDRLFAWMRERSIIPSQAQR